MLNTCSIFDDRFFTGSFNLLAISAQSTLPLQSLIFVEIKYFVRDICLNVPERIAKPWLLLNTIESPSLPWILVITITVVS